MLAIGVIGLLLVGCGGGGENTDEQSSPLRGAELEATQAPPPGKQPLVVVLDGYASPENVGVLLADRLGYFADAGLDLTPSDPSSPLNVISYVADGTSAFGISHQPQIVAAKDESLPVVAVGSVVPVPTLALIWLPSSGIGGVSDLAGKAIGITGFSFEENLLRAILGKAGLTLDDVEVKRPGTELAPALEQGRVDAILGTWNVEGFRLEARGLDPVIRRVQDLGVPGFEELVAITTPQRLSKDPNSIRAFMSAVVKGTQTALEHPQMAAEAIAVAQYEFGSGGNQPQPTAAEVKATLPLLSRTGIMSVPGAARLSSWMHAEGFVGRRWPPASFMTNRYLAAGP
jgi:putative hydroxymethylpyrimidine transport system substrate-binding protein